MSGQRAPLRRPRPLRLLAAAAAAAVCCALLLSFPVRGVIAQSSSSAMDAPSSTGDVSTAVLFVDPSSSSAADASSAAMDTSSTAQQGSVTSAAVDSSSASMDSSAAAMDPSSSASAAASASTAMADSSSAAGVLAASSSAVDVSSAAALLSSAMDSSASMLDSSSAMDSTAATMAGASSAMDSSAAAIGSSAAADLSSSAVADLSSSALASATAPLGSSSAVATQSSTAVDASSAALLPSAMGSSSAPLVESSSAMDSTAAAMAGSSSAPALSSSAADQSSAASAAPSTAAAQSSTAPTPISSSAAIQLSSSAAMQLSSSAPAAGSSSGAAASSGAVRVPSSSSAGVRVAVSSTGTVNPTVVIPETLPVFQLSLSIKRTAMATFSGSLQAFATQLRNDIASVCSVRPSRVFLLRLADVVGGTTSVLTFTITDSLATSDQSPRAAGTLLFGSLIGNGASIIVSGMPALVYMLSNTLQLAADQTVITPDLPYVRLGLQYQIDSLPGGSAVAFSERLLVDLARACGVSLLRVAVQRLLAGSVYAYFLIAPQLDITEPTAPAASDNFMAQAGNATSPLYVGADVTSAAIFGSAVSGRVATPPPNPPATVVSEDNSFWNSGKRVGTVFGIAIAVIIGGAVLLALLWYFVLSKKQDKVAVKSYDQMHTQKTGAEMTGISVHTPPAPAPAPVPAPAPIARPSPPPVAAADARDIHFTLAAGGYGSVRNLRAKAPDSADDDHAHFELVDDVAAQPYFKGAQGAPVVGPRPTVQSVIDRHAPPATLQRAQSTSGAQPSPVSSGPPPPGSPTGSQGNPISPLGQARSPGSFRISFSKQQRPLPSMLPRAATLASPGSSGSSAPRSASPVAAPYSPSAYNAPPGQLPPPQRQMQAQPYSAGQSSGAPPAVAAYPPQASPYSVAPSPAAANASSTAASDAQLRMKLRKAAAKQGGGPATPADAYASEYPAQARR